LKNCFIDRFSLKNQGFELLVKSCESTFCTFTVESVFFRFHNSSLMDGAGIKVKLITKFK